MYAETLDHVSCIHRYGIHNAVCNCFFRILSGVIPMVCNCADATVVVGWRLAVRLMLKFNSVRTVTLRQYNWWYSEAAIRIELQTIATAGRSPEVPDLAIVPRLFTRSSLVIPMPRSRIDKTCLPCNWRFDSMEPNLCTFDRVVCFVTQQKGET